MRYVLLLLLAGCATSAYDCDTETTLLQAQTDFAEAVKSQQACLAKGGIAELRTTPGGYIALCKFKRGFES